MEAVSKAEEIIKDTKRGILEQLKDKLKDCDNDEVYFHDIVADETDCLTPTDRNDCIKLIDLSDSKNFDEGMIDRSSLDRTLITMAYLSIEDNLFNDDFIQELQDELNNEKISKEQAKKLINKIDKELSLMGVKLFKRKYEDNSTQVFLKTNFEITQEDFKNFIDKDLNKNQFVDLSESVKILTSNKAINQNAVMIDQKKENLIRVYIMDKDKDLDIRNFFKAKVISEDTGFNLSPSFYIEQTTEQYEADKKNYMGDKKNYQSEFKNKEVFLKVIIGMCQDLTKRTS